ncbi:MAG: hypothetical protein ACYS99_02315 [Planctomycetota bacterium]
MKNRSEGARTSLQRGALASVLLLALLSGGCKLLYPPGLSAIVLPIAQLNADSLEPSDFDVLVEGREETLQGLRIGVLRNPGRNGWSSQVDGEVLDERVDENELLREYLEETGLFGGVEVVDDPLEARVDYVITCSSDCIYDIELNSWMYAWNWTLLGFGFLLGWPHQNSEGSYVTEAAFYKVEETEDGKGRHAFLVGGTISTNVRTWYGDNIYWRPDFYSLSAMEPMFDQLLYDFLSQSGCLE